MKLALLLSLLLLVSCASQSVQESNEDQSSITKRSRYNLDR